VCPSTCPRADIVEVFGQVKNYDDKLASKDNLTIAIKKNIKAFMGYTTKTWVGSVNKTLKDKPSLGKDKLRLCT
jgi:hypothetical protein